MAWEAVTKDEVAKLAGVKTTDLRDEWYAMAVDMIKRYSSITDIGSSVVTTENRDGNNSRIIAVNKPPIVSVQSIYIDGDLVPASAIDFDYKYIYLKTIQPDLEQYYVFTSGSRNLVLNYTSGSTTIDHSVSLAIALIVKEFANLATGEGAESRIQFYRPGQSEATEAPLTHWGVHGKVKGIIETLLGLKVKIA